MMQTFKKSNIVQIRNSTSSNLSLIPASFLFNIVFSDWFDVYLQVRRNKRNGMKAMQALVHDSKYRFPSAMPHSKVIYGVLNFYFSHKTNALKISPAEHGSQLVSFGVPSFSANVPGGHSGAVVPVPNGQ